MRRLLRVHGHASSASPPRTRPGWWSLAVIQDPKNGHYGGKVAAPVFKDVMTFALKTKKIPPTGTKPPSDRACRAGG